MIWDKLFSGSFSFFSFFKKSGKKAEKFRLTAFGIWYNSDKCVVKIFLARMSGGADKEEQTPVVIFTDVFTME